MKHLIEIAQAQLLYICDLINSEFIYLQINVTQHYKYFLGTNKNISKPDDWQKALKYVFNMWTWLLVSWWFLSQLSYIVFVFSIIIPLNSTTAWQFIGNPDSCCWDFRQTEIVNSERKLKQIMKYRLSTSKKKRISSGSANELRTSSEVQLSRAKCMNSSLLHARWMCAPATPER